MTRADYDEVKHDLLHVATIISPSGKEQRGFVRLVADLEKESESDNRIIIRLLGSLLDGMCYGNWPGMSFKIG